MALVFIDQMEYEDDVAAKAAYVSSSQSTPYGGNMRSDGDYTVHEYITSTVNKTFLVPTGVSGNIELLVVGGGGGGGGGYEGGGGGGGGVIHHDSYSVSEGYYDVSVGEGGVGYRFISPTTPAGNGGNSSFGSEIAIGGGAGGTDEAGGYLGNIPASGGSGGGGVPINDITGEAGTSGQGYAGGDGYGTGTYSAGGGGGAGGVGGNATSSGGGAGGVGIICNILGSGYTSGYAGGGGGASRTGTNGTADSTYGGGNAGTTGYNAISNQGGGGGGGRKSSGYAYGGKGGSGIVVARYLTADLTQSTVVLDVYTDQTVQVSGMYSLKVVAAKDASVGETITKIITSPIDLTDINYITFKIRSNRTGANLNILFRDSGLNTFDITPDISTANTWQTATIDISAVANADKDAIDRIIISVVDDTDDGIYHIDSIVASTNEIEDLGYSWAKVFPGFSSSTAIDENGRIFTWGQNESGYCGQGNPVWVYPSYLYPEIAYISSPTQLGTASNWVKADSGELSTIAMNEDGELWGWGVSEDNCSAFALPSGSGEGTNHDIFYTPVRVAPGYTFKDFAHDHYHTLAIGNDNKLYVWGSNNDSCLGLGLDQTIIHRIPFAHPYLTDDIKFVGCKLMCSAAVTSGDSVYAWGKNNWWYNSDSSDWSFNSEYPVEVTGLIIPDGHTISCMSVDTAGIVVVLSNGEVWATGDSYMFMDDETSFPDGTDTFHKLEKFSGRFAVKAIIECMGTFTIAILDNRGNIFGWSDDWDMVTGAPVANWDWYNPFYFNVEYPGQRKFTDFHVNSYNGVGLSIHKSGCLMSCGQNNWGPHLGLGVDYDTVLYQQLAGFTSYAIDSNGDSAGLNTGTCYSPVETATQPFVFFF